MDKKHYFAVYWETFGSDHSERHYSRRYDTEAEAVKKARQADKNPATRLVRVAEKESWETPDPAPNGTVHISILRFIPWWME